jgi:ABC-type oligopeptide transport system substrate-binding subunit
VLGTFESINPFIARGLVAQGMRAPLVSNVNIISGQVVESLMARGYDEPFTLYGLVARTIDTDEARSYVTFELDPAARFSDGKPVTPEDIIFSWQLLRDKGRPNHRFYYSKVVKAEALGTREVRFDLTGSNDRELPLILGLMPVLAKHAVNVETFEDPTYTPPVGTGPYIVSKIDPGKSVTLTRNRDYWGRDLSVNRGFWNFGEIRYDYYRDSNSHHEAFKRGLFDLRAENDPSRWQTGYDFPALRDGRVVRRRSHPACRSRASILCSTRGGRSSPTVACARRSGCCSILNGPIATCSSVSIGAPQASSKIPSCRRIIGPPRRASEHCSRRFLARCAPTCSMAPGRCQSPTDLAAIAPPCEGRSSS